MEKTFLTAEWRKLVMANYRVHPEILIPYLPPYTELDFWDDACYVSLVGFMFRDTKLKGIKVPFHSTFEEVNLRFYVRYNDSGEWKRGVVFIKEIVPKPMLSLVANMVYGEHYQTMRMKHNCESSGDQLSVGYQWKKDGYWNSMRVVTDPTAVDILPGSEEEFITEHFWGYTKQGESHTSEYAVEHPSWQVYPVRSYNIDVDFGEVYGEDFAVLSDIQPCSVFLAEGSEIVVRAGRLIRKNIVREPVTELGM